MTPSGRTIGRRKMIPVLGGLLLVVMTVVVYIPAMQGGFIWDDDDNVTENVPLRTLHGLKRIWIDPHSTQQYYPLTHTSFWIQYQLWGLRPFPYHLGNVLLHALGSVLLWLVLRRLAVPGAWLAAAVFATHPVHVESVAWVTERKNVLAGVFFLASTVAYLRHAGLDDAAPERSMGSRSRLAYGTALLLFIGAVLAKTVTALLPAILLVLVWWKKGRLGGRDILPTLPMFVIGAAMGATTYWLEKHHVGAIGNTWDASLLERFLVAGRVVWFYLGKLVWPVNLVFIYPKWQIDSSQLLQYLFPIGVAAALAALFASRHRIGRGPFAAALVFVLALVPASGFFNVFFMRYSYVQDHFQYFASMGMIALLAALVTFGVRRMGSGSRPIAALQYTVPAAILLALGMLTWKQGAMYQDSETLYRSTLARNAGAWMAHYNLGHLLLEAGRMDEAISHLDTAVRLNPNEDELQSNLGVALGEAGEPERAFIHLTRALELNPRSVASHINFGSVLVHQGKLDQALSHFEAALRLDPRSADAHCNAGVALRLQGQSEQAIDQLRLALQLDPDHAMTHINLGGMLFRQGKTSEAARHFAKVLEVDPNSVEGHINLGQCLWAEAQPEQAIAHFRRTLELRPAHAEAANNLAWILATSADARLRNGEEAVRLAELACRSNKVENSGMLDTLAAAYANAGRFEEAVSAARRALTLARSTGQSDLASKIQNRLDLYERHQPFRNTPAARTGS